MALWNYELARMTTATTGTGTITLGSPVSGFKSFAGAGVTDAQEIFYGIRDGANSEIGYGNYTASGTTLSRNVISSTNSDSEINLSGNAEVFIGPFAAVLAQLDAANVKLTGDQTVAGKKTFTGFNAIQAMQEKWEIVEDNLASGDNNFDALTAPAWWWTTAGDTNATLNFRGDGSNTLNSLLAVGKSITFVAVLTHTGTAYLINALKIDGSAVTPKWVDGTAPDAGSENALDVYVYTIIKTADETFTVLAQRTKWDEA